MEADMTAGGYNRKLYGANFYRGAVANLLTFS
jgi:hypothetical protein